MTTPKQPNPSLLIPTQMITLKTSENKSLKETTVTAYNEKGNYITHETWAGLGARIKVALAQQVRSMADNIQNRANVAATITIREGRQLAQRRAS
jgi:hypothetical protein